MEDDLEPALTGDFNSGQRFAVLRDVPGDYYLVQDALGRAVASLPLQRGEIRTRAGRWRIGAERQRHGWAVVAHAAWDGGVVARASPSWRFAAYRLWFSPTGPARG